jgi:hypothetical protein
MTNVRLSAAIASTMPGDISVPRRVVVRLVGKTAKPAVPSEPTAV